MQLLNEETPTLVALANDALTKLIQLAKALSLMKSRLSETSFSEVHSANAYAPVSLILGKFKMLSELQLENV